MSRVMEQDVRKPMKRVDACFDIFLASAGGRLLFSQKVRFWAVRARRGFFFSQKVRFWAVRARRGVFFHPEMVPFFKMWCLGTTLPRRGVFFHLEMVPFLKIWCCGTTLPRRGVFFHQK